MKNRDMSHRKILFLFILFNFLCWAVIIYIVYLLVWGW